MVGNIRPSVQHTKSLYNSAGKVSTVFERRQIGVNSVGCRNVISTDVCMKNCGVSPQFR